MSKTLQASCTAGVVTSGSAPVPSAQILSEGVGASEGILVLDEDKAFYMAKTSPDLKTTLDKLVTVLGKVVDGLTALDTAGFLIGATGGVPSLPVATVAITEINAVVAELNILKGALK